MREQPHSAAVAEAYTATTQYSMGGLLSISDSRVTGWFVQTLDASTTATSI